MAPVSADCEYANLLGVAATAGGLVLAENTCVPEAGDDSAERGQVRLVAVDADDVEQVPSPPDAGNSGLTVLAASADGDIYVRADDPDTLVTTLWRRPDQGEWELLSLPARAGEHHSGDGGPAVDAVIEDPQDVEIGSDVSVYVMEPYAVRRIAADGVITTVAGSDRNDPAGLSEFEVWGSGGGADVVPDPRPLPSGAVRAIEFPLPRLTAMDADDDGSLWLASHDAVLRLTVDGTLVVHADASSTVPDGPQSRLVGARGSSSSITDIVARDSALLLVDSWSSRVLRLRGRELTLVLGRPDEQRASCPPPVLGEPIAPTTVCAGALVEQPSGGVLVTHYNGVLTIPTDSLNRQEPLG